MNHKKYHKKISQFKKDLDNLAELSWQEEKTKKYIVKNLGKDFYWSKKTALIYKLGKGTPIFFRAELDALNTGSGPKHICGHSAHLAGLMGAYLYSKDNQSKLKNTIYFIFQPSEESYPGGAEFISKNFSKIKECKVGFALHVFPNFKVGETVETIFAAGDYIEIDIKGRAVHTKDKQDGNSCDALVVASELVKKINTKETKEWIVNVGTICGGEASNRVAGHAKLTGDVRSLIRGCGAEEWLKKICREIQKKYKYSKIKLSYFEGYPILKSDDKFLKKVRKILGIKKRKETFAAEDFSLYPVPKVFLLIGTGEKKELHSDNFSVKDQVVKGLFINWIKIIDNLNKII